MLNFLRGSEGLDRCLEVLDPSSSTVYIGLVVILPGTMELGSMMLKSGLEVPDSVLMVLELGSRGRWT